MRFWQEISKIRSKPINIEFDRLRFLCKYKSDLEGIVTLMNEQATKRRKDCFFGLHSDFHAVPEDGLVLGGTLKEGDIREICECLKPDFVQVDCKGHPGWASYPTKMSNAMPNFKVDPLMLWRKITKEYGIGL